MRICLRIEMLFLCTMKIWLLLGGGVALLYATKALENLKTENEDQRRGIHIIQNALKVCFFFFPSLRLANIFHGLITNPC